MAYCGPRGIPYDTWLGWDDLSRAAAVAWAEREADRCHGCGLHRSDLDERHMPVVGEYHLCPGCKGRDLTQYPQGVTDDKKRWYQFRWRPRTPTAPTKRRASRRW